MKIGLIFINIFLVIFINYKVFAVFKVIESFPKAFFAEQFWIYLLLILIILNFRFEKKIFKHQNYYLSLSLIFVDFLILLPIIFFTINEAIFLK